MLTWIGWIGIFLLTVGLIKLLQVLGQRGLIAKLRVLVVSLLCISLGALGVALRMALRAFEAFSDSTLMARVQCQWVGSKTFDLTYAPVQEGKAVVPTTFRLRGNQWSLSGGVVKWHPWLTALGLPSYHKPTRISGRYADAAEEAAHPPTTFSLGDEPDPLWWWFYRFAPWLPFVEAVYGSAAFVYVAPGVSFEIYVTPSGYFIERKRLIRPQPTFDTPTKVW